MTDKKVGIIGGCGHVGIPLGLVLADSGCRVTLIDTNQNAVDKIIAIIRAEHAKCERALERYYELMEE